VWNKNKGKLARVQEKRKEGLAMGKKEGGKERRK